MRARLTVEAGECLPPALDLTPGTPITLGRSRDSSLVVRDELASRLHAKVYFEDGRWFIRDFGLNGTQLNGQRVTGAVPLEDGAGIRIGQAVVRFSTRVIVPPNPTATQVSDTIVSTINQRLPSNIPHHGATKVHEFPTARSTPLPAQSEAVAGQLQMDEITALCKFMKAAVGTQTPHELITLALRAILHQTIAQHTGYVSLDPDDPTPKVCLPESAKVDLPLSRRLTQKAHRMGKTVWLTQEQPDDRPPTESLTSCHDAICVPLHASGAAFAALHAYHSGRSFADRDVRFIEAVAGFLAHGLEIHRTRRTLEAENSRLRIHAPASDDLIGSSTPIMHLRQQILRAAPQSYTVLVHGESGSGKELVALAIHRNSRRAKGPLVVVNCAAIAPTLLEAELFGYKKGAFSGADRDHAGLFQQADEGTLFLDEVAELSLECQAKLLRIIEGKAFRPVGASSDLKVDVRIVAATHRNLEAEVKAGRFRQDLYYRLRVIQIRVPSLQEHAEDIPELAEYYLARVAAECRRSIRLTPAAMHKLQSYSWPGNVRQLGAVIQSAAVMNDTDILDADSLPLAGLSELISAGPRVTGDSDLPPSLDMDEIETWAIRRALRQTNGNISHAAKLLGVSRDTLHTKLKKKGIDRDALVNTPTPVAVEH